MGQGLTGEPLLVWRRTDCRVRCRVLLRRLCLLWACGSLLALGSLIGKAWWQGDTFSLWFDGKPLWLVVILALDRHVSTNAIAFHRYRFTMSEHYK